MIEVLKYLIQLSFMEGIKKCSFPHASLFLSVIYFHMLFYGQCFVVIAKILLLFWIMPSIVLQDSLKTSFAKMYTSGRFILLFLAFGKVNRTGSIVFNFISVHVTIIQALYFFISHFWLRVSQLKNYFSHS